MKNFNIRQKIACATLLVTTALSGVPAMAATDSTAAQIKQLQDQLRAVQTQLQALQAKDATNQQQLDQVKADRDADVKAKMAAEAAAREEMLRNGAKVVFQDGKQVLTPVPPGPKVVEPANHRFQMSSGDGAWTIAPTGRVHFDYGGYLNQKPETANTLGVGDNKLTSGVNVRRARLGVTGKAMNDFTYTLILDGGGSSDSVTNANGGSLTSIINTAQLSYTGFRNTSIDFGYFAQYAIMEEAMSSNDILFMERATPVSLGSSFGAGDPRFGAGFRNWDGRYFLAAYITGSAPGALHQNTYRNWNAFGRFSYQLVQEDTQTLHLGGGVITTLQVPNTGPGTARSLTFSDRPELRIDPTNFINTGVLGTVANPVKSSQVYNIELAATYRAIFFQSEYFRTTVNRDGRPNLGFDGGYAEVSYAWGGTRKYTANCGCYGGINPIEPFSVSGGGAGAWEIAARISYANFTDLYNSSLSTAAQTPGFANGGRQTNFTGAVNWFINSNMMFKFNYVHSNLDKANASALGGIPAGITMDAIAGRVQFVF